MTGIHREYGKNSGKQNLKTELSVVIPSYNTRDLLKKSLEILFRVAPDAEVIVTDGSENDDSAVMVEQQFPEVKLIRIDNHGWGYATNRGIEVAKGQFILLMNSDLFMTSTALTAMLDRMRSSDRIGAVGPLLRNEDGTRQKVFGAMYLPNWLPPRTGPQSVFVLSGACILTSRKVLDKIGGIDETFFLYNEELDWCTRARAAGYSLELLPESVVHLGGGSTEFSAKLRLESQRGFLYLSKKHWPPLITETLRRAMQFQGWGLKVLDQRSEFRDMWQTLESIAQREAYEESPYRVSGRGAKPAHPFAVTGTSHDGFNHSLGQPSSRQSPARREHLFVFEGGRTKQRAGAE